MDGQDPVWQFSTQAAKTGNLTSLQQMLPTYPTPLPNRAIMYAIKSGNTRQQMLLMQIDTHNKHW